MTCRFNEEEIRKEMSYRYQERIALSCGDKEPCEQVKRLAMDEAKAWEARIREGEQRELFAGNAAHEQARGTAGTDDHAA